MSIKLTTIDELKEFVSIVNRYQYNIDCISGRYTIDAKSILGLLSLDLSQPITIPCTCFCDRLLSELIRFRASEE